ncbi:phage tail sheath family protein [Caballeronia arationis]|nr:phage tail sheath C-terminal domain-containing protein [Caballeronia arationis]
MPAMKPGVYIEHADAARVPPVVLRTDVAAFVGIAQRGPLDTPVPVESMRQFSAQFGDFIGGGYLAYAVRGFFDNGGLRCWVVRVATRDFSAAPGETPRSGALAAGVVLAEISGQPVLRIEASSPGNWGNALDLAWAVSGQVVTDSLPAASTPQASRVSSTAGFAQDELVRIEQGSTVAYRVIADIDAVLGLLYWQHPDPQMQRATDRALGGFDVTQPLRIVRIAYALIVRERGSVVASYRDLHLVPAHPRYLGFMLKPTAYWSAALGQSALDPGGAAASASGAARDDAAARALPRAPQPIIGVPAFGAGATAGTIPLPLDVRFDATQPLAGGADGLSGLTPDEFIGEPWDAHDDDFTRARKSRGLQALALIDEIALVALPDVLIQPQQPPETRPRAVPPRNPCLDCPPPPAPLRRAAPVVAGELPPLFTHAQIARVQAALIDACDAAGDRFALLGLPFDIATAMERAREDALAWRDQFDARCAALAAPWLRVDDPVYGGDATRLIPACGHVLGAIARTDLKSGVQQAPGNVTLNGVIGTERTIDDALHAQWNDAGIDVLRADFGRDPLFGGARTLARDAQWRYINIVRLMLTIKKAADLALRWVVFEPNDEALRATVRSTLLAILRLFHARGAFAGETEASSFFVRCDDVLNPPAARDAGELVALVGFAPATPAEFIVLRIGRRFDTPAVALFDAVLEGRS